LSADYKAFPNRSGLVLILLNCQIKTLAVDKRLPGFTLKNGFLIISAYGIKSPTAKIGKAAKHNPEIL